MEVPKDFSSFTTGSIDGFISDLQTRIKGAGIGTALYDSLTENLRDAQTFGDLIKECIENGVELEDFDGEGIWKKILSGDDPEAVKNALSYALGQLNGTEGIAGVKDYSIGDDGKLKSQDEKSAESDGWQQKSEKMLNGLQSVSSGLQTMGIQLPSGVTKIINVAQGLMQIIQGVQSVVSIFNTTTAVSQTMATTANTSAMWYNTMALTSLKAAMITNTGVSALKFAHGGIVRAASGLHIPGSSYSGDRVPALVNSGELILNQAQQGNLASQLEDAGRMPLSSSPYVDAETIYVGLNNFLRRKGLGELVVAR